MSNVIAETEIEREESEGGQLPLLPTYDSGPLGGL
jgi:hypothetical protein